MSKVLPVYTPLGEYVPEEMWYDDYLNEGWVKQLQMAERVGLLGKEMPIPGRKPWEKLIGVSGHPRGATRYAAEVLNLNGYSVGHEQMARDGIVHYGLAVEGWLRPLNGYKYDQKYCIVRNPWRVLSSACLIDRPRQVKMMSKALGWGNPVHDADAEDTAVVMLQWYNLAIRFADGNVIKAEDNGFPNQPKRIVNASRLPERLTRDDFIRLLSQETFYNVCEFAEKYHYE